MEGNLNINSEIENKHREQENMLGTTIIPFCSRKSSLLSITFRSFDLELGQFRIKIESDGSSDLKTPILSQLCETTMVRIKKLYLILIEIGTSIPY